MARRVVEKAGNGGDGCWSWCWSWALCWALNALPLRCPAQPPPKLPPLFTAASPPRSPALLQFKETRNQTKGGVILYGMAFWHANGSSWGQYMGFRTKPRSRRRTTNDERRTTNGRRTKSCCFRQVPSDAKHQMSKMSTSQPGREQHKHSTDPGTNGFPIARDNCRRS